MRLVEIHLIHVEATARTFVIGELNILIYYGIIIQQGKLSNITQAKIPTWPADVTLLKIDFRQHGNNITTMGFVHDRSWGYRAASRRNTNHVLYMYSDPESNLRNILQFG